MQLIKAEKVPTLSLLVRSCKSCGDILPSYKLVWREIWKDDYGFKFIEYHHLQCEGKEPRRRLEEWMDE